MSLHSLLIHVAQGSLEGLQDLQAGCLLNLQNLTQMKAAFLSTCALAMETV